MSGKAEMGSGGTLPLVEKYRPADLANIVCQTNIVGTLTRLIEEQRLPHLLFYGPPGTGKTSTILACARKMYGSRMSSMTLELNASDERGIDVVRNQIKTFASTQQIFSSGCKLVILDEADAMTNAAQFALRRIIEKYTKSTRFCLIANYTNRIIPALQSRCTRFRFAPLSDAEMATKLSSVAAAEGIVLEADGAQSILDLAQGDMRKVLNTLQSVAAAAGQVTADAVHSCTGTPRPQDVELALEALLNRPFGEARDSVAGILRERGLSLIDIVSRLQPLVCAVEDFPAPVLAFALAQLADLEYRLSAETSASIQLAALVAIFVVVRDRTMNEVGAAQ